MLDPYMMYSCAYWKNAKTLNDAQEAKLDLICKKIDLQPGMTVLDLGCGWGGFARFAAKNYGVRVVGVTISNEQVKLARELCNGLPIEIQLKDYRDASGQYDRIVSIGMFEHVGPKNYKHFVQILDKCLKKDGMTLVHTIGHSDGDYEDDGGWFEKYIFPNAASPSIGLFGKAIEHHFVMEDWHNFGYDYYKTLCAWYDNFNNNWKMITDQNKMYDQRFYRMWKFYLLGAAGAFYARKRQLWQIVLSKHGIIGGYQSLR